jgi:predicted Zn-dependent peptidase
VTLGLGRGRRLHVLSTDRFTTTVCRVALHRDLGPETTTTAVLASVLRAATERFPSRRVLAEALAGLYGASLSVGTERLGDRLLLSATMEWPTAGLPGADGLLAEGLEMLGDVLARPKQVRGGFDPEIVATERTNQARALQALKDEKGRYALRRALSVACAGEPYALDPEGRAEDLDAVTPATLAGVHAALLARAPAEIFVVGDLTPAAADALLPAAHTLAGVLGGGPYARLFKVVRETHGLCYYASAGWNDAKGLLVVQVGIDPANEARARKLVLALASEVGRGVLEPEALRGYREAVAHRVASLADSRGGRIGWAQEALALGVDASPQRWLERLLAVKPGDVARVGRKLALDTVFFLGSDASSKRAPAAAKEDA